PRRPRPPSSPLFPYTTLFRSIETAHLGDRLVLTTFFRHRNKGTGRGHGQDEQESANRANEAREGSERHGGHEESPQVNRGVWETDRKSTRLNSSHLGISYAVF